MQILTVDIGAGTQDIFLYEARLDVENGLKLVLPSPTMIVNRRLKQATRQREAVLLEGVMMGGGPSQWAVEAHLRAGLAVYATPEAAQTFNDDLAEVQALGVTLVSEDEAARLPESVRRIELLDFNFPAIVRALEPFGVSLGELAAVAVAVFDHGAAPQGYSDRQFRFDYLDRRIRAADRLSAFAYRGEDIPPLLTRLRAVALSAQAVDAPLVVMDSAPAAVLGALYDPHIGRCERLLAANVGNFHTLAFRLGAGAAEGRAVEGVFEHHTGLLDRPALERLLYTLADGTLRHADVFETHGHGALLYDSHPLSLEGAAFGVAVTGPRRSLLAGSALRPYFAVPFGDMMLAGCFGLLSAVADVLPDLREPIHASLHGQGGSGTAPWEL